MLLSSIQSTSNRTFNESLTGPINGINTGFTTVAFFEPGPETVYFNGVRQQEGVSGDYVRSESGGLGTGYDTITFAVAPRIRPGPKTDDSVTIDYDPA